MPTCEVTTSRPVLINKEENLRSHRLYWIGRRTQDIILSALALVVLSPVMLLIAVAIMIDDHSAGPIFYQDRVGRNGKLFRFYKFRSMCADAEAKLDGLLDQNEMDGPVFKIKDDPRITRVGKIIRKTSLDELPQLWNILKGDMSIVGPRPALPREVEQYGEYEMQRFYVTPGLSCYWQIAPHRNELSFAFFNELGKLCELTVLFELHPDEINDRDKTWGKEDYRNFKAIYLKKSLKIKNDNLCVNILKYLSAKKFDRIVVGMYSTPTQMLAIAYLKLMKIPYALNSDGGFVKNDSFVQGVIKRFFISGAKLYFASSKGTEKYLRNYGATTEVSIYPFTTKLEQELPQTIISIEQKTDLRKKLGLPVDKKIVISVGQFIHRKGFDTLIKAAAKLDDTYYFLCIGGKETEQYKELRNQYELDNFRFLEFMQQELLGEYYRASDVFVLPTREDIWGLVINEAMSFGLPVITTDNCLAGTELVQDGKNGYIVPVDDVEEIAKSIEKVFMSQERYAAMQKNNHGKMLNQYTIEKMALAHYEALIKSERTI